jgi:hypothetical protein
LYLSTVVEIQQKEISKVVDKGVERHYNRNIASSRSKTAKIYF